jgi:tetratricopeptide (TPR) repeat protein
MAEDPAADIARAERLIEQALATLPRSPLAHLAKGHLLRAWGRPEEATPEYEMVIASNRNWAAAFSHLGWCKLLTGSFEEAIALQQQAIRLSPRDPYISIWYFRIGYGHLLQSRLVRKGARRQSGTPAAARLPRRGLWTQGLDRTRCGGARRSAKAQRRPLFEHRPAEGGRAVGSAGRPILVRGDLFRRVAQGGNAGDGTAGSRAATERRNLRGDVADLAAIGSRRWNLGFLQAATAAALEAG